ncbi:MAG: HAD family hydrolase [Acidimicrobiales bacterium]
MVLFDLDNTLLDRDATFRRWAAAFVSAERLPAEATPVIIDLDDDGFAPRVDLFADVKQRFGLAHAVDVLVARYRSEYVSGFELSPDTEAGLKRLRNEGWKIGVVSNGPKFQERKLEVTGLGSLIDAVCVSGTIGFSKPDPRIFEEAACRCGTRLDGWMVGDTGSADIVGGQRAGLRTIWIRRGRTWDLGEPAADAQVDSASQAIDHILSAT